MRYLLIIVFLVLGTAAMAQSSKKKRKKADASEQSGVPQQQQPNSLNPTSTEEESMPREPKRKRSRSNGPTYDNERQYYDRMEAVAKARRKSERAMADPQYSNPMYFGHKRPPKKHKPGKMKYCKECGLRH
ncbi:hypothetical protein [Chryseolinea lacunae]|uniref:Secreted protein n=1 Tax=Chryseolinea lacunae TaxID=2801331 RepID=A0ABS1KS62_9BACT|nr:hypothetical protein [Chryseolinea lacunae]MBL0742304.1 hypothetical protein [Chryseolinea lacunae]